jgi:hypothetical protein
LSNVGSDELKETSREEATAGSSRHPGFDTPPDIEKLKAEVAMAVRGAIARAMLPDQGGQQNPSPELDFSLGDHPATTGTSTPLRALPAQSLYYQPPQKFALSENGHFGSRASAVAALAIFGLVLAIVPLTAGSSVPDVSTSLRSLPTITAMAETVSVPRVRPNGGVMTVAHAVLPTGSPTVDWASALRLIPAAPAAVEQKQHMTPLVPSASPALARQLLEMGRVSEARSILLSLMSHQQAEHSPANPELLLDLARSFDPNCLGSLPSSDARPDPAQARRLYRQWFDVASKMGDVSGTASIDRLLASLDPDPSMPAEPSTGTVAEK